MSLTVEADDDEQTVRNWLEKAGAPDLNIAKASTAKLEELRTSAGEKNGIPVNVLVTADGNAVDYLLGARDHDALKSRIEQITK